MEDSEKQGTKRDETMQDIPSETKAERVDPPFGEESNKMISKHSREVIKTFDQQKAQDTANMERMLNENWPFDKAKKDKVREESQDGYQQLDHQIHNRHDTPEKQNAWINKIITLRPDLEGKASLDKQQVPSRRELCDHADLAAAVAGRALLWQVQREVQEAHKEPSALEDLEKKLAENPQKCQMDAD